MGTQNTKTDVERNAGHAVAVKVLKLWKAPDKEYADHTQNTKTGVERNADRAVALKAVKLLRASGKEYADRTQNTKTGVERNADRAVALKAWKLLKAMYTHTHVPSLLSAHAGCITSASPPASHTVCMDGDRWQTRGQT